jgi:hypothetical protein
LHTNAQIYILDAQNIIRACFIRRLIFSWCDNDGVGFLGGEAIGSVSLEPLAKKLKEFFRDVMGAILSVTFVTFECHWAIVKNHGSHSAAIFVDYYIVREKSAFCAGEERERS